MSGPDLVEEVEFEFDEEVEQDLQQEVDFDGDEEHEMVVE